MSNQIYKLIIQVCVLTSLTILAYLGIFDKQAITLIFGSIAGYAYSNTKENLIKKK